MRLNEMHAVISDIHGNLEALDAVTAAIEGLDVICLGDVVCYGPDSIECVRRSADWDVSIAGPLDLAMIDHHPEQWDPTLNAYIEQSRARIDESDDAAFLLETLGSYLPFYSTGDHRYFHGTMKDVRGWIFPEEIYCPTNIEQIVGTSDTVHFVGGSHIPGVFRRTADGKWTHTEPQDGEPYELPPDQKTVVAIGSVGQPRDGDPRASYAIADDTTVVFHRVEYNLDLTRSKIQNDPDLDDLHGRRLYEGR